MKIEVKILIDNEKLTEIYNEAVKYADSGIYLKGSNYWSVMFIDKLKEQLENKDFYKIERL